MKQMNLKKNTVRLKPRMRLCIHITMQRNNHIYTTTAKEFKIITFAWPVEKIYTFKDK